MKTRRMKQGLQWVGRAVWVGSAWGLLGIETVPGVETATSEGRVERLPEVVVADDAGGITDAPRAASEGSVTSEEIRGRVLSRPGEVLETVPGLILTQHSGAGKANQFFLRGFNLDHGTDFATSLSGIPINLPSHGHGQGYTDLNLLIPELVERVDYRKGPYSVEVGDFGSAGAADMRYYSVLPHNLVSFEGGSFGYGRGLIAASPALGSGRLLYALELFHNDGPWKNPDDYQRLNGVVRFSQGDAELGWSATAMAYAGRWEATDQIAKRALEEGVFGRFDTLNPTSGGDSQRYSLSAEWHRQSERSATEILGYGFFYDFDLFSDFTYFLTSPQGDQFEQKDRRWVGGLKARHTWNGEIFEREMANTVGMQLRSDTIRNGLFQTVDRVRVDKLDHAGGVIPSEVRSDRIWQASVSPYVENRVEWADWFRSVGGVRTDFYRFDVRGSENRNGAQESDGIVSPRGSLVMGPWAGTELYMSGGLGFHSNDARGITSPNDSADPLVRTYGAEVGVQTSWVPGLQSSIACWWLDVDSELVFVGDAGNTEASRSSRRYGVEWANAYTLRGRCTLDFDISLSHAEFRDEDPAGRRIPGAVEAVVSGGIQFREPQERGFFGGIRIRYFGARPLVEDGSVESDETLLVSMRTGYRFNRTWRLTLEVLNLLDRRDSEIDYYYPSRLRGESVGSVDGGYADRHFHPVDPLSFRAGISAEF